MEDRHSSLNQTGGNIEPPLEIIRAGVKSDINLDNKDSSYNLAVFYYNTGNALFNIPLYEQAIKNYERSLEKKSDFPEAYHNMGNAYRELGKTEKALECYRKALDIKPYFAEACFNMGNLLSSMGETEKAIDHLNIALCIKPEFPEANINMGNLLCMIDRIDQGIAQYKKAIEISPMLPEAYCGMGNALNAKGNYSLATKHFKKALELRPGYNQAIKGLNRASKERVPIWHFAMMNDKPRNDAYRRAIEKTVQPDSKVLEIGAGAGLLSMMAVRAGAKSVITCEMITALAEKSEEIIKGNGFSNKIKVLNKKSQNLKVGYDMPEKANLLITEIFDVGLIGEGAIPAIHHARSKLLTPDAKVLPQGATVYAAILESKKLYNHNRVNNVEGFDLSSFNEYSTSSYFQAPLSDIPHRMLSAPFKAFSFNFNGEPITNEERQLEVKIAENGVAHAIAFWFTLQLTDDISINTAPTSESHWQQAVQLLPRPVFLRKNRNVIVFAQHDCHEINFDIGLLVATR